MNSRVPPALSVRASSSVFALLVALAAGLSLAPAAAQATQATQAITPGTSLVAPNRYGLPDFSHLVETVGPAVVNISITQQVSRNQGFGYDPFQDFLRRFGVPVPGMPVPPQQQQEPPPQISRGVGSGFIVSGDGYVLTNAHVVDGAQEVTVRLTDKREFKAEVVGTDARTDVALLKIDAQGLPFVRMGDAEELRVGEWVVAMGSPFGFENTVTAGIVSAKARRLPDENYVPFLQTDVAINPGNSGGPLFNLAGEVIGINSQIYSRSGGFMGISFAIPIDVAMKVKEQLREHGRVQRGRLGINIQSVDRDLAQSFGLDSARGALISIVEPGSPADKSGLVAGDVVLSVDNHRVGESADLPRLIGERRPGDEVNLEIWRNGSSQRIRATLGEMPSPSANAQAAGAPERGESAGESLGIVARNLTAQESSRLGVSGGVVVEGVNGPAANAGLRRGDVVLALNNQPISDIAEFRKKVEAAGKRFALLIQRGEGRLFVPVQLP